MDKRKISIKGVDQLQLLGSNDENLRLIEASFDSQIIARGDDVVVMGEKERIASIERIFAELIFLVNRNGALHREDVKTVIDMVKAGGGEVSAQGDETSNVIFYGKKGLIQPKTEGQESYYSAVRKNDIVFVVDPIEEEIAKFKEVLVDGVGLKVVAIADRDTPFDTIRVPQAGEMAPYVYLCAGWNVLVEIGNILNINLDKPERARKVGNELIT